MFNHLILSTSYTRRVLLATTLALSLGGCSLSPSEDARPLGADVPDPEYALTVALSAEDTLASVEAEYNGKVLVWEPGTFAVIGGERKSRGITRGQRRHFFTRR